MELDKLEALAKAARDFQPEPPSDGWPEEPEVAPPWSASGGWLEDGGHAAFARQHEYWDEAEIDGAAADAAFIAAFSPEVALSLIAAARELKERRWVPVSERMPPKTELVIAANKHGNVSAFWWDGQTEPDAFGWHFTGGGLDWRNNIVTHWMPLPKGPTNGR